MVTRCGVSELPFRVSQIKPAFPNIFVVADWGAPEDFTKLYFSNFVIFVLMHIMSYMSNTSKN